MREIYSWTEWFAELADKIAENDEEFLIDRVQRIPWKDDGSQPVFLESVETIDPFTVVCTLAFQAGSKNSRNRVFPKISESFGIEASLAVDSDEAFQFRHPTGKHMRFHFSGEKERQVLWRLFRNAVRGLSSVNPEDFDGALTMNRVSEEKLTQALFLTNPQDFIACDDQMKIFVDLPKSDFNWAQYREWLQKVRATFPGCKPYEINLFANLWQNGDFSDSKYFHVSTHVDGNRKDHWNDFRLNNCVYTGGPKSKVSWGDPYEPQDGDRGYPLREPQRGDVVLVRTGIKTGRGIGIVYKNDHRDHDHFVEESRVHVVWVNIKQGDLPGKTEQKGFNYAKQGTLNAFRTAPTYAETFELLAQLNGSEERMSNQKTPQNLDGDYSLNQILYGPPGTGKTYQTVDRALAIIDGEKVREREEGDIGRFRELRDSGRIAMVTFHQNFAYEDFIEGIRPDLDDGNSGQINYVRHEGIFKRIAERAKEKPDKQFVLIIDEINRGNIAKIFGELITLIEDSRRLGNTDETKVTLPYSQNSFGIPNNLYLIGTMNTADRSIQLLDAALRRRFDFVEMMPEPEHKDISTDAEGVNCQEMLKVMNERITALLDRDHQIGHTYLLYVETMEKLSDAFQNKIFPLLQEYFFDDWSKIQTVLGGNSFVVESKVETLLFDEDQADENPTVYERVSNEHPKWKNPEEYKKIYSAGSADDTSDP